MSFFYFFTGEPPTYQLLTILGMAGITVLSRSFFLLSESDWELPRWVQRGLQFAPIAALAAVIVPEIVMTHGEWSPTWRDARLYAACTGVAFFYLQRGAGHAVLGTIVSGMVVYLPLHIGWGW